MGEGDVIVFSDVCFFDLRREWSAHVYGGMFFFS